MEAQELARFYALLAILEPDAVTCEFSARIAEAGTATDIETDTAVTAKFRSDAGKIAAELASVSDERLDRKAATIAKLLAV